MNLIRRIKEVVSSVSGEQEQNKQLPPALNIAQNEELIIASYADVQLFVTLFGEYACKKLPGLQLDVSVLSQKVTAELFMLGETEEDLDEHGVSIALVHALYPYFQAYLDNMYSPFSESVPKRDPKAKPHFIAYTWEFVAGFMVNHIVVLARKKSKFKRYKAFFQVQESATNKMFLLGHARK